MEDLWARLLADTREAALRADELHRELSTPEVAADTRYYLHLERQYTRLLPWAQGHNALQEAVGHIERCRKEQEDQQDAELVALLKQEEQEWLAKATLAAEQLQSLLSYIAQDGTLPCELTVRTAGGDPQFAVQIARMYAKYLQKTGFECTLTETAEGGRVQAQEGAWGRLRYESGLHRRNDGANATVAVMPQAPTPVVEIAPEEIRVDIFCSSGKGGQNINKVETAVRVTHLPTGMVVTCQDERSQLQNKKRALAILASRLRQQQQERQAQRYVAERDAQVRDRSHPVRRYDTQRNTVCDTRTQVCIPLKEALRGNLDTLVQALALQHRS